MQENYPVLISCNPTIPEQDYLKKINVSSEELTIGRALNSSVVIPVLSISRKHCVIRKTNENEWTIEDHSLVGIQINRDRLGKGAARILNHEDIITLEPSQEYVYKFMDPSEEYVIPKKRIKLEPSTCNVILNNVKIKFEESQSYEIKHIEDKIQNAKQMQTTTKILKQQLQLDMSRKMQQLENDFAQQIENLKGEKNEVEKQKILLIEERDTQLSAIKLEMEGKITDLMEQIKRHNETESELLKENNSLKEKLEKEREEFISELSRESSSKQDMLDKLQAKIKEQEEIRLKEKQELEDVLRKETEQLRLAKEKELKELEEEKKKREEELEQKLSDLKKNFEEQFGQTEQQRLRQELNEKIEQIKKLSNEEKARRVQEREQIQQRLAAAEIESNEKLEKLASHVKERETQLAVLAADRIQKQAEQSSEVIRSLQEQLEKVRTQLQSVETEKNTLLESICHAEPVGEGTSKQSTLAEVGELMESELQCSICAELFVAATTLSCSHTFCKYCITMWKRKKKDCPICRASITSECRSLVLDSFIDKMVENLTEDMKKKRLDLLKYREAEVAAMTTRSTAATTTSSSRRGTRSTRSSRNTRTTRTTTATTPSNGAGGGTTTNQIPIVDLQVIPIPTPNPRPAAAPPRAPYRTPQNTRIFNFDVHLNIDTSIGTAISVVTSHGAVTTRGSSRVVDLTTRPITYSGPTRTVVLPVQEEPQVFRILQHNGQVMVLTDGGVVASLASRAPTTAGTGAASAAAPAATGRRAAPSGSRPPHPR